ncbi:MAG TPA: hypothetical protein P5081_04555 [Phycisphaerae bacterium]|nr:hypothetical protein [Phycisphaerae bacterium]HRW52133.1 hypothetical protein [Phycisphaerae bacterium]
MRIHDGPDDIHTLPWQGVAFHPEVAAGAMPTPNVGVAESGRPAILSTADDLSAQQAVPCPLRLADGNSVV